MTTRAAAVGSALALAMVMSLGAAPIAYAEIVCSDDACDGNLWQAARGPSNENSYWRMSPGHNCTNYVAWKLITGGVQQPPTHPGDAADWAAHALEDGYVVDATPAVGAVAQWDSFAGGNGIDGHVAYVEQVNADGTILISEDYWHDGDQLGPLTFRTIDPATVSNFIHYGDISQWLRQVGIVDGTWQEQSTGLRAEPTALTAVNIGGTAPTLVYSVDGILYEATAGPTGWNESTTGLKSESTALSAVSMLDQRPQVMSLEGDMLYLNASTGSSWQKMSTGLRITGEIAALDLGGLWSTVMVSQGGSLYRAWGDMEGWHAESTGLESWGPIAAVTASDGHPEVFSIENGMLHRFWADDTGWHKESTGVFASGKLTAATSAGRTQLTLVQDDAIFSITEDETGWHKVETGIAGGTLIASVDMGGTAPLVIQAG